MADPETSGETVATAEDGGDEKSPRLASYVVVTWVELTAAGIGGGLLGAALDGPPRFVVSLATSLLSVGILLYNVDRLIRARIATA